MPQATDEIAFPVAPFALLDPASITVANDAPIPSAPDSSGNNRNATGASDFEPVLNVISHFNTFRFDNGKYFHLGDYSSLTSAEIFIVRKLDADPPETGVGGTWLFGTSGENTHNPYPATRVIYDDFGSTTRKTTVAPESNLSDWHIYSAYSAANSWGNFLNGTQLFETTTNSVAFSTAAKMGQSLSAGIDLNGNIAYMVAFPRKFSTSERGEVVAALQLKFADLFE